MYVCVIYVFIGVYVCMCVPTYIVVIIIVCNYALNTT